MKEMSALLWFLLACSEQVGTDSPAQISVVSVSKARELPADPNQTQGTTDSLTEIASVGWKQRILDSVQSGDRQAVQNALEQSLARELGSQFDEELISAALRFGQPSQLESLQHQRGRPALDFLHPVVEQVAARAEQGQANWDDLEQALYACQLLDNRPTRGLQKLGIPVPNDLVTVSVRMGAQQVVLGRPIRPGEHKGLDVSEGLICRDMVWTANLEMPARLPRFLVFVAVDSVGPLYISIRPEERVAVAFSSNNQVDAERLLEAGLWWDVAGDGREERLHQVYGTTYRAP